MICSYFGISFFEFAKNVYLQILYENIYTYICIYVHIRVCICIYTHMYLEKNWTWNIKYWNLVLELLTLSTKRNFPGTGRSVDSVASPGNRFPLWKPDIETNRNFCSFTQSNDVDVRSLLMFCSSRNRNSSIRENVVITFVGERERMRVEMREDTHVRVISAWLDRGMNRVEINHHLFSRFRYIFEHTHTHTSHPRYFTSRLLQFLLLTRI